MAAHPPSPTSTDRFNAAALLHRQGLLDAAAARYGELLRDSPLRADALHMLGLISLQQGRRKDGIRQIEDSLGINPRQPMAHANLARAYAADDRVEQAVDSLGEALRLDPRFVEGLLYRAGLLAELRRRDEAVSDYTRVLELQPGHTAALNNRGNLLLQIGDAAAAKRDYESAIRLEPQFAEAHNNLGSAMLALADPAKALECADRALALRPGFAEAHNNRGNALRALRRSRDALGSFERALALRADYPEALGNICGTLVTQKQHEAALPYYERLVELAPEFPFALGGRLYAQMQSCLWTDSETRAAEVRSAVRTGSRADYPWYFLSVSADPEEQLLCARTYVLHSCPRPQPMPRVARLQSSRIRLAYMSSDFGDHPVTHLAAGLIAAHDRERFEVVGISLAGVDEGNPYAARLRADFDRFLDISALDDSSAATLIAGAGVDILVDLNGHTHGARPHLAGMRPAPIQVGFLGFAGTSGAPWMDYLVGDSVVLPMGEPGYSESLVRLPGCCLPRDDREPVGRPGTRSAEGLPADALVFCAFNAAYKLTPTLFDSWMRILRTVPDGVLWLRHPGEKAVENLRREASARGVEPSRLVFATRVPDREAHLSRLRLADLFLDTQPYGAHSTASDALYAGLPVLTCRGTAIAGRIAASLLLSAGLPELVAADIPDYERIALTLASDREGLAILRQRVESLRIAGGPFDTRQFARRLEKAYERMWALECAGKPPADINLAYEA